MMKGPFVTEKLGTAKVKTPEKSQSVTVFPQCDFTIAQRLAKRWLKHQNLCNNLSTYGVKTPTPELEYLSHTYVNAKPVELGNNGVKTNNTQHHRSLKQPAAVTKDKSSGVQELIQNGKFNSSKRQCHIVTKDSSHRRKEDDNMEMSKMQKEVRQMRRSIKFYADRLAYLQAEIKDNESQKRTDSTDRCLNAQVSRQIYALSRQLSNHICTSRNQAAACTSPSANLSFQQLNSVHKSVIRCLESFVTHHDYIAENEQRKGSRSVSPVPSAPLPSAQLYGQLCALLEQISQCCDRQGMVTDPEFQEAINLLKPLTARQNSRPRSVQAASVRNRKIPKRNATNNSRVRFEKHEQEQSEKTQVTRQCKEVRSKSMSPSPSKRPQAVPIPHFVSRDISENDSCSSTALLKNLVSPTPSQLPPSRNVRRSPSPPSAPKIDSFDVINRLRRIELEHAKIQQRWRARRETAKLPIDVFQPAVIRQDKQTSSPCMEFMAVCDHPKGGSPTFKLPVAEKEKKIPSPRQPKSPPRSQSPYLRKVIDIIQNKEIGKLIDETLDTEVDRLESIANRLIDHLLQSELLITAATD